jgi:hypothetical protein
MSSRGEKAVDVSQKIDVSITEGPAPPRGGRRTTPHAVNTPKSTSNAASEAKAGDRSPNIVRQAVSWKLAESRECSSGAE